LKVLKNIIGICILLVSMYSCAERNAAPLVPASYENWATTLDGYVNYPIPGHNYPDNSRKIFINSIGDQVEVTSSGGIKSYSYPEGTIVIKEIYGNLEAEGDPEILTVMVKNARHKSSIGGWVWLMKDPQTGEEQIVDQQFCFRCHITANDTHFYGQQNPNKEFRDYLFFPYEPKEP
jgi:hypothetical protein